MGDYSIHLIPGIKYDKYSHIINHRGIIPCKIYYSPNYGYILCCGFFVENNRFGYYYRYIDIYSLSVTL